MKQTILVFIAYLVLSLGYSQAQEKPKPSVGKVPTNGVEQNRSKLSKAEMMEYKRKVHAENLAKRKSQTNIFVPKTERSAITQQRQKENGIKAKQALINHLEDLKKNNPKEYNRINNLPVKEKTAYYREMYQQFFNEIDQKNK